MPERGDSPRTYRRTRIGLGFASQQAIRPGAAEERPRCFAYCNLHTSGVKSFADDLAVRNGPVSSRVALSLRSAEGRPCFAPISPALPASSWTGPGWGGLLLSSSSFFLLLLFLSVLRECATGTCVVTRHVHAVVVSHVPCWKKPSSFLSLLL